MKKLVALCPISAAFLVVSAVASTAPQNVRQDVGRLVLLPGPYLTTPAKGAPQPTPVTTTTEGMIMIGAEPAFRFQTEPAKSEGMLQLASGAGKISEFAPAPKPVAPANPEALRFGEKLPATTQPSLLKTKKKQPASNDAAP